MIAREFEQLHHTVKSHIMEVLDSILAHWLLNNANFPEEKKQLVKATVNEVKYETHHSLF